MLFRNILLIGLCLFMAEPLNAKQADSLDVKKPKFIWRGGLSMEAGSNFHLSFLNEQTHNLGNVGTNLGFQKGDFDLDFATKLSAEHQTTGKVGGNVRIADNDTTMKADASVNDQIKHNTQTSLKLKWKKNKNLYSAYYSLATTGNTPNNYNLTTIELEGDDYKYDYSLESGDKKTCSHKTGVSFEHVFPKTADVLNVSYDHEYFSRDEYSLWSTGRVEGYGKDEVVQSLIEESRYRSTPSSNYNDGRIIARYSDKKLFNVRNLEAEFAANVRYKNLKEYMRMANYVSGEWRDSLAARENFYYYTLSIMPAARVRYKRGIYNVDLIYSPEYFRYILNDENHDGGVNKGKIANLIEITNTLNPWPKHTISLKYKRSDTRPEYQQICWFPRFSSIYANEIYVGNPDLKNSITTDGRLSYLYTAKRFSVGLELADVLMPRKIAKTYNNQTFDGKEYRVYTWINGGLSNEVIANVNPKWKGKQLGLSLNAKYRYYLGYSASGSETRSSDYNVSGNASYTVKTWRFEGNAAYQSGIDRSYFSTSSLIDGNFKITKTFGKCLTVYLFGQNLLDRPVLVETKSEDEKEIRYEKLLTYKRLIKLGVIFKI